MSKFAIVVDADVFVPAALHNPLLRVAESLGSRGTAPLQYENIDDESYEGGL